MILISYDIKVYRKQLKEVLNKGDTVVELGCHVGNTSEIIAKNIKNGKLIALDNSPEAIPKMNILAKKYNNLKFISGDVRLHTTLKKAYKNLNKCDVLSVDLGGGYHPDTTFKVYFIWASLLKPKITLIRNRGLIDFVRSSKTEEVFESNEGWLESCGNEGIPPQIKEFELWSPKLNKNKKS
ncbi:MAG: methyltransferase domain-containing protein [Methanobrevibacter arboriphilus]|uniref:Methyltransferase domain-containing protein n=1 Tax=Methanobrevibacter arboriphilus TaxID=39441 RepID=A0A843AQE8_METAZ|nr:methyltransferase domain-containing protein [Methanobrevibacter arboriphilus]MBF4468980.1 methyltransferase domain-containing protein [Methanobrevibacter arboriphilus]